LKSKKKLTLKQAFETLTGKSHSSGLEYANQLNSVTPLTPPVKPGAKPQDLDSDSRFAGFYDWISEKVERAKTSGFLSLPGIVRDLKREEDVVVSLRVLRRTMRKLGFVYAKRKGLWISRRQEYRVQVRLWGFVKWAVENSTRVEVEENEQDGQEPPRKRPNRSKEEDGKQYAYFWNFPVGFQDESWVQECAFPDRSWCKNKDRTKDNKTKGEGSRVNMIHTIFANTTDTLAQPIVETGARKGKLAAFVAWKSTWTGKTHEFRGNFTNAGHIRYYFDSRVFPQLAEGGVAVIDNAQTHKEHIQDLKTMDEDELKELIMEKTAYTPEEKRQKSRKFLIRQVFDTESGPFGMGDKELRKFIMKHHLYDTVLGEMSKRWGVVLNFLPQYHPECNPIERFWAELKRRYYNTDPNQTWVKRMEQAMAQIHEHFAHLCIQKSLKWCYKKYDEMKRQGWPKSPPKSVSTEALIAVYDEDAMSSEEEEEELETQN